MKSNYVWNREIESEYIKWIFEINHGCEFVLITFAGRVRSQRVKRLDAELVNANLISKKNLGRGFSKSEIERGFKDFMKQLDIKYIHKSKRKNGIKLKRIPFLGGDDDDAGTWNHIHAYVQKPGEVPYEEFREYMELIAQSKMMNICGKYCIVETDVWCKKCEQINGKFIKYALRPEGDFKEFKFDKLLIEQVYLGN